MKNILSLSFLNLNLGTGENLVEFRTDTVEVRSLSSSPQETQKRKKKDDENMKKKKIKEIDSFVNASGKGIKT